VVPGGTVRAAVLSAGGLTAVLTDRGVVELWEPVSGEKRATFSDADQRGTALALSPDGRVIAFLSEDSRLRLGDVGTGEERMQLDVGRAVRSVAVSNDGGLIAVASDRFVTVWEVDGARRKEPLHRQELSARLVTFHPGGNAVAFAAKNSVRVQSLPDAGETSPVSVSGGAVTALAFNSQKDLLAAAGKNELKIWNTGTLEEVLSANLPGDPWALGFMRSGSCIALTSAGQLAQIWNAVDGTEVSSFLHDHDVKAATLSADGRFAATATTAGDLWIWKADVAWDQPSAKPQRNILRRFVDVFRGGKKRRQEKQSR
jgi:WD40 repeat protein